MVYRGENRFYVTLIPFWLHTHTYIHTHTHTQKEAWKDDCELIENY